MQKLFHISGIFSRQEQNVSTHDKELCAVISFLTTTYIFVQTSKLPKTLFTAYNPLLRKKKFKPHQNKAQTLLVKVSKLRIVHTVDANLAVADMLSRNFSKTRANTCQSTIETLQPHIDFYNSYPTFPWNNFF